MIRLYNYLNIAARKLIAPFYSGERKLPLLHCNFEKLLKKNYPSDKPFYFVQVGAFDGIRFDSLFDFVKARMAKGMVIEPIQEHFDKLTRNYSYNKEILALNLAIHSTSSKITLYRVNPEYASKLPDWAAGISSQDPLHHLKTNIPSEMIVSEQVSALPLMEVVRQYYRYKHINLFQIDTEGYDYEILRTFDFALFSPDIIKLEYINLAVESVNNCIKLLKLNNYYCLYEQSDLIGIKLSKIRL